MVVELIDAVDELNCMLGVAYGYADVKTRNLINETQAHLYMLHRHLTEKDVAIPVQTWIEVMQEDINDWEKNLPELTEYLKPRAYLRLCSAISRRAERLAASRISTPDVIVVNLDEVEYESVFQFLHKLTDWLFTLARKTDQLV